MQNCPSVLPDSRPTGSAKCKTALLYCPNLTPRAVSHAKTHKDTALSQPPTKSQAVPKPKPPSCTAQITHRRQCHRRNHTNALPFHSRPPILRQCQNQNLPTALPNLPNTSTQRQCCSTINNSPLPPCTLRSTLPSPCHHTQKKTPPPGTPGTGPNTNQSLFFKYSFILNAQKYGKVYMLFALPTLKSPSFIPYEISL